MKPTSVKILSKAQAFYDSDSIDKSQKDFCNKLIQSIEEASKDLNKLEEFLKSPHVTQENRIVHANCEEPVFTINLQEFRRFQITINKVRFSFVRGNYSKINIEDIS